MLPQAPSASQPPRRVGVGIDTSRYGHYAALLRDDLQPAAADLRFAESADGYAQLRTCLQRIAQRHRPCHFVVRLDAAGQYADNLRHFLQELATGTDASNSPDWTLSISCGDPQRNKNYRAALYGNQKSDPVEAHACANFALKEKPAADIALSPQFRILREIAGRLQAVVRQRTRLINQLHQLLGRAFPELALLVKDIAAGWVLELIHRFPSASRLAQASANQLQDIPYLPHQHVEPLLQHARTSVASLQGPLTEEIIRDQIRQLRDTRARQKRLEDLLVSAYQHLPDDNRIHTIPGLGDVTSAVLTAFIVDIERFLTPNKLVAYFGTLPIEAASGVERDGKPRGPRRYVMSPRGNDLARRYLWMAALSAIRFNPAIRALYARVVAKHPDHKAIAVGHAMRKLLHLVWAIWKTGRPFNPNYYPWPTPAHVDEQSSDNGLSLAEQAAGLMPHLPARSEVTTACTASLPSGQAPRQASAVDFAHVKRQLPIARVLDQLGLSARLKGRGPQKRCTCPIHRGDARGRTFSVHLDHGVFQCFDKDCGRKGDVIDLWASVVGMSLRDAALDLVRTFDLEAVPRTGTEKRKG
jgi:transposase